MESEDGGAEDNNERPKQVEGHQPQELTEQTSQAVEGHDEDVFESEVRSENNVGNVDAHGEDLVKDDAADNNLKDKNGTAQPCEKRRISDEESGENIVFLESESTHMSSTSQSGADLKKFDNDEDDDVGLVSYTEHVALVQDAGDDMSAKDNTADESMLVKDADGTSKQDTGSSLAPAFEAKSCDEVDEELENFFKSAQAEVGKFPGLDNVDLASDEDGHEGVGAKDERVQAEPTQADLRDANYQEEFEMESSVAASREGDGGGEQQVKASPHKDYPLNYRNYKVCREVEPGVKECLILETGEQVVCIAKSKVVTSPTTTLTEPVSASSPRPVIKKPDTSSQSNTSSSQMSITVVNPAEAFAYISFENDIKAGSEKEEAVSLISPSFLLKNSQEAFITENGIPVILDNAEDDVKLDLQAKMDRLGKIIQSKSSPTAGHGENQPMADHGDVQGDLEQVEGQQVEMQQENEPVADVLSSGGDGDSGSNQLIDSKKRGRKSKKRREKQQRFYELQPDDLAEDRATPESSGESEGIVTNTNSNNNYNDIIGRPNEGEEEDGENMNNSAYERDRATDMAFDGREISSRKLRSPLENSHDVNVGDRRQQASDVARSEGIYSPLSRRVLFNDSSRHFTSSGGESLYSRYGERTPLDSSHMSTRISRLDRGDPSSSSSMQESLTIPRFKTLYDQQVSWLEMFKMIEDQHRTELQSQYSEHQRILHDMQHKMERELSKQQNTLKHRLQTHKEILQELSPGRHDVGRETSFSARRQDVPYESVSHTTVDGTRVALKYPPPLHGRLVRAENEPNDPLPVKRSLERDLSSPSRPTDTSLNLSEVSVSGDKLLRGGVYSSPMPLAKAKQKKSKSGKPFENKSQNSGGDKIGHNTSCNYGEPVVASYSEERTQDTSLTESDDVISPRSRVSLREKHAKHVADLRAYYEDELKEMRKLLSSRQSDHDVRTSVQGAEDRILTNENAELRQRCQDLDDQCHDLKIERRELQQKIQGLEIRATDYAKRFDDSQSQVRSLHERLEELTEFAKEKESTATDLKSKNKTNGDALQAAYKKEKELADSLHAAKTTIQKLVEKYETLERDHQLLKENMADKEEKLFASRKEAMDTNNKLSRLELENKQMIHDKEVLKHELTMARSSAASMHTSYDDAFPGTASTSRPRSSQNATSVVRSRSIERSHRGSSRDRNLKHADPSPDSETESDFSKSPIIRAERELKKLRESVGSSQEFAPKLQRKYYGTETSHGSSGYRGSSSSSPNQFNSKSKSALVALKSSSPRDKKGRMDSVNGLKTGSTVPTGMPSSSKSPNCRDKNMTKDRESDRIMEIHASGERSVHGTLKRLGIENGWSSDQALERIKAGEVVSRPGWEDIYTSMAPARSSGHTDKTSSTANATRDQLLRERLQNIDMLERKYDDLSSEKRKFESALSKVPVQGSRQGSRRERERLEAELDRVDRELGSVRMSLKRFHVLKSTI